MLAPFTQSLALAGHPMAWAVLALFVVIVFAPSVLPMLARLAGRLFQIEIWRRLGGLGISQPAQAPRTTPAVEVIPPLPPRPRPESARQPEIIEAELLPPRKSGARIWPVVTVVLAAIAVLSWILFHQR